MSQLDALYRSMGVDPQVLSGTGGGTRDFTREARPSPQPGSPEEALGRKIQETRQRAVMPEAEKSFMDELEYYDRVRGIDSTWRDIPFFGLLGSSAASTAGSMFQGVIDLARLMGADNDLMKSASEFFGDWSVRHAERNAVALERAAMNHGLGGRAAVMAAHTAVDTVMFLGAMKALGVVKPLSLIGKGKAAAGAIGGAAAAKATLAKTTAGAMTGAKFSQAGKFAAKRFVLTPGSLEDKSKAFGMSFAYMSTPALSMHISQNQWIVKAADFAMNSGISIGTGQWRDAIERGTEEARANNDEGNKAIYILTNLIPVVGTDFAFSMMTKPLAQEQGRVLSRMPRPLREALADTRNEGERVTAMRKYIQDHSEHIKAVEPGANLEGLGKANFDRLIGIITGAEEKAQALDKSIADPLDTLRDQRPAIEQIDDMAGKVIEEGDRARFESSIPSRILAEVRADLEAKTLTDKDIDYLVRVANEREAELAKEEGSDRVQRTWNAEQIKRLYGITRETVATAQKTADTRKAASSLEKALESGEGRIEALDKFMQSLPEAERAQYEGKTAAEALKIWKDADTKRVAAETEKASQEREAKIKSVVDTVEIKTEAGADMAWNALGKDQRRLFENKAEFVSRVTGEKVEPAAEPRADFEATRTMIEQREGRATHEEIGAFIHGKASQKDMADAVRELFGQKVYDEMMQAIDKVGVKTIQDFLRQKGLLVTKAALDREQTEAKKAEAEAQLAGETERLAEQLKAVETEEARAVLSKYNKGLFESQKEALDAMKAELDKAGVKPDEAPRAEAPAVPAEKPPAPEAKAEPTEKPPEPARPAEAPKAPAKQHTLKGVNKHLAETGELKDGLVYKKDGAPYSEKYVNMIRGTVAERVPGEFVEVKGGYAFKRAEKPAEMPESTPMPSEAPPKRDETPKQTEKRVKRNISLGKEATRHFDGVAKKATKEHKAAIESSAAITLRSGMADLKLWPEKFRDKVVELSSRPLVNTAKDNEINVGAMNIRGEILGLGQDKGLMTMQLPSWARNEDGTVKDGLMFSEVVFLSKAQVAKNPFYADHDALIASRETAMSDVVGLVVRHRDAQGKAAVIAIRAATPGREDYYFPVKGVGEFKRGGTTRSIKLGEYTNQQLNEAASQQVDFSARASRAIEVARKTPVKVVGKGKATLSGSEFEALFDPVERADNPISKALGAMGYATQDFKGVLAAMQDLGFGFVRKGDAFRVTSPSGLSRTGDIVKDGNVRAMGAILDDMLSRDITVEGYVKMLSWSPRFKTRVDVVTSEMGGTREQNVEQYLTRIVSEAIDSGSKEPFAAVMRGEVLPGKLKDSAKMRRKFFGHIRTELSRMIQSDLEWFGREGFSQKMATAPSSSDRKAQFSALSQALDTDITKATTKKGVVTRAKRFDADGKAVDVVRPEVRRAIESLMTLDAVTSWNTSVRRDFDLYFKGDVKGWKETPTYRTLREIGEDYSRDIDQMMLKYERILNATDGAYRGGRTRDVSQRLVTEYGDHLTTKEMMSLMIQAMRDSRSEGDKPGNRSAVRPFAVAVDGGKAEIRPTAAGDVWIRSRLNDLKKSQPGAKVIAYMLKGDGTLTKKAEDALKRIEVQQAIERYEARIGNLKLKATEAPLTEAGQKRLDTARKNLSAIKKLDVGQGTVMDVQMRAVIRDLERLSDEASARAVLLYPMADMMLKREGAIVPIDALTRGQAATIDGGRVPVPGDARLEDVEILDTPLRIQKRTEISAQSKAEAEGIAKELYDSMIRAGYTKRRIKDLLMSDDARDEKYSREFRKAQLGTRRENFAEGVKLFRAAGWDMKDQKPDPTTLRKESLAAQKRIMDAIDVRIEEAKKAKDDAEVRRLTEQKMVARSDFALARNFMLRAADTTLAYREAIEGARMSEKEIRQSIEGSLKQRGAKFDFDGTSYKVKWANGREWTIDIVPDYITMMRDGEAVGRAAGETRIGETTAIKIAMLGSDRNTIEHELAEAAYRDFLTPAEKRALQRVFGMTEDRDVAHAWAMSVERPGEVTMPQRQVALTMWQKVVNFFRGIFGMRELVGDELQRDLMEAQRVTELFRSGAIFTRPVQAGAGRYRLESRVPNISEVEKWGYGKLTATFRAMKDYYEKATGEKVNAVEGNIRQMQNFVTSEHRMAQAAIAQSLGGERGRKVAQMISRAGVGSLASLDTMMEVIAQGDKTGIFRGIYERLQPARTERTSEIRRILNQSVKGIQSEKEMKKRYDVTIGGNKYAMSGSQLLSLKLALADKHDRDIILSEGARVTVPTMGYGKTPFAKEVELRLTQKDIDSLPKLDREAEAMGVWRAYVNEVANFVKPVHADIKRMATERHANMIGIDAKTRDWQAVENWFPLFSTGMRRGVSSMDAMKQMGLQAAFMERYDKARQGGSVKVPNYLDIIDSHTGVVSRFAGAGREIADVQYALFGRMTRGSDDGIREMERIVEKAGIPKEFVERINEGIAKMAGMEKFDPTSFVNTKSFKFIRKSQDLMRLSRATTMARMASSGFMVSGLLENPRHIYRAMFMPKIPQWMEAEYQKNAYQADRILGGAVADVGETMGGTQGRMIATGEKSALDWMRSLPAMADQFAMKRIFYAAAMDLAETRGQSLDSLRGNADFWQDVRSYATKLTYDSQPTYEPESRSALHNRRDLFSIMVGRYGTQRNKMLNLITQKWVAAQDGNPESAREFQRAVMATAVQNTVIMAAIAGTGALWTETVKAARMRDGDHTFGYDIDEETPLGKAAKRFATEAAKNPFMMVEGVDELLAFAGAMQGAWKGEDWRIERATRGQWVADTVRLATSVVSNAGRMNRAQRTMMEAKTRAEYERGARSYASASGGMYSAVVDMGSFLFRVPGPGVEQVLGLREKVRADVFDSMYR